MDYVKETIRQQCRSFVFSGCWCQVLESKGIEKRIYVLLTYNLKSYYFSDPDLNVIIAQLAFIYQRIKHGIINRNINLSF